jgi:hypothetical protein
LVPAAEARHQTALISIAGQVLEALSRHGNIALVSSPNEQKVLLEQAATTPLVRYMTNGERLSWAGYDVKLHESGLLICCSGESLPFAELKLPRTGDRGRQVCVLAAWRLGEGIPVLNKTLGALYPLRDASRPAREKVVEILNQAREQGKNQYLSGLLTFTRMLLSINRYKPPLAPPV